MNNHLLDIAKSGDFHQFQKECIRAEEDTNWKIHNYGKSGDTILTTVARLGHFDLLKCLINQHQVDLEQQNFDGKTALHEAAQHGHLECLRYILSSEANVDPLKRADWTPLLLACTKDNLEIVQTLVEYGANVELKNKDGWNCFHVACREGHSAILNYLLSVKNNIWDSVSYNGRTPLHTAALHGKTDAVLTLLKRCLCSSDPTDNCGVTPLMDALRAGHVDTARVLLQFKADIHKEDILGRQCIHLVSQAGSLVAMDFILQTCGRDDVLDVPDTSGATPLHFAVKEGQVAMAEYLIKNGCDLHKVDNKHRKALHIACGTGHVNCVKILLETGYYDNIDINTAVSLARTTDMRDLLENMLK